MKTKQKIIKVVTAEVKITTQHYTYEVVINEDIIENFIEKMNGLCGHNEIYSELNNHNYRFISCENGKQYLTGDNFLSSVDEVSIVNQLPLNL